MTESDGESLRRRLATGCFAGFAVFVVWTGVFVLAFFYWDYEYSRPRAEGWNYRPLGSGLADLGEAVRFGFAVASAATSVLAVTVALWLRHGRRHQR